jgi:pyridoxamine 5'-phosphate oxidase
MAMADMRREYSLGGLWRAELDANPMAQFNQWFAEASAASPGGGRWRSISVALFKLWQAILGHAATDANTMVLATVDREGRPSARAVLLKGTDERGFIFFTNYDSRKSRELAENHNAALTFYWPDWERQVCVAGPVEKISREESEKYFKGRPRGSQLAAWASNQSGAVENRAFLEAKWKEMETQFSKDVPLPLNWGGFVLKPERIEFWQGRRSRLHDRFQYTRQPDNSWKLERLAP